MENDSDSDDSGILVEEVTAAPSDDEGVLVEEVAVSHAEDDYVIADATVANEDASDDDAVVIEDVTGQDSSDDDSDTDEEDDDDDDLPVVEEVAHPKQSFQTGFLAAKRARRRASNSRKRKRRSVEGNALFAKNVLEMPPSFMERPSTSTPTTILFIRTGRSAFWNWGPSRRLDWTPRSARSSDRTS